MDTAIFEQQLFALSAHARRCKHSGQWRSDHYMWAGEGSFKSSCLLSPKQVDAPPGFPYTEFLDGISLVALPRLTSFSRTLERRKAC